MTNDQNHNNFLEDNNIPLETPIFHKNEEIFSENKKIIFKF